MLKPPEPPPPGYAPSVLNVDGATLNNRQFEHDVKILAGRRFLLLKISYANSAAGFDPAYMGQKNLVQDLIY